METDFRLQSDFRAHSEGSSSKRNNVAEDGAASGAAASSDCCFSNYDDYGQSKRDISLDLTLQKTGNLCFAADQTPTPTRLIKNCEEVGLFEDLQHVNPFDIGFQRAVQQNVGANSVALANDGDSLHTPQVYPLATDNNNNSPPIEVPNVEELLAETPPISSVSNIVLETVQPPLPPPAIQLIQPQLITWLLPPTTITVEPARIAKQLPVQTVRPFILPKAQTTTTATTTTTSKAAAIVSPNVPSSASLTPTSQLPIKERLKAILNSNNRKERNFNATSPAKSALRTMKPSLSSATVVRNEDCMERRRAAASRYRNKMRNEHKELQKQNEQLQLENRQLRERVANLEEELQRQPDNSNKINANLIAASNHIQIPPSSIHLVINMPKLIVPSTTPSYRLEHS